MTIGIAAFGPRSGSAVIRAVGAVEAVGRGAIGGFVSLVVIAVGRVHRAETQRGGIDGLFGTGLSEFPEPFASAPCAGIMSSGPNRPEPLSQFTPADPAVGLVTGHRMPNTVGASGKLLNDEVLDLMRRGSTPRTAVGQVVGANPDADAGIIALSIDGRIHAANSAYVAKRRDIQAAQLGSKRSGIRVAVLLNSIQPWRSLALLAAETAMDAMSPNNQPDGWITFREGTPLRMGAATAVEIDLDGKVTAIVIENAKFLAGNWSFGIGFRTQALKCAKPVGEILYEPYMTVNQGRVSTIDGGKELSVPIRFLNTAL